MKHTAELVVDGKTTLYHGASGSQEQVTNFATTKPNSNVTLFYSYLNSISDKYSFAPKTAITNAFCCAEPHAIMSALAANEDPIKLRFRSIKRHEMKSAADAASSSASSEESVNLIDAQPCTGYCGKYISGGIVTWSAIVARVEEVEKINASSVAEKKALTEPKDGFLLQSHARKNAVKKINKKANEEKLKGSQIAFNARGATNRLRTRNTTSRNTARNISPNSPPNNRNNSNQTARDAAHGSGTSS